MNKLVTIDISELKPYENNPRINDDAVPYVIESIKEFGFCVPIITDKNNVIIAGHTRYKACQELEIKKVPCIVVDNLTDEQVIALRLLDNKIGEKSQWDYEKLKAELETIVDINMERFGFINIEEYEFSTDEFVSDEPLPEKEPKYAVCEHCGKEFPLT